MSAIRQARILETKRLRQTDPPHLGCTLAMRGLQIGVDSFFCGCLRTGPCVVLSPLDFYGQRHDDHRGFQTALVYVVLDKESGEINIILRRGNFSTPRRGATL